MVAQWIALSPHEVGLFCVEFTCSPHACMGLLWVQKLELCLKNRYGNISQYLFS